MSDGRGEFFAVDKQSWVKACELGMPPAVAYLVLANGTGRDNLRTSWSTNAIERYTGIGRKRAKTAIDTLINANLLRRVQEGPHPKYEFQFRPALDADDRKLFDRILAGKQPRGYKVSVAERLRNRGWLSACDGTFQALEVPSRELIWLPNDLVRGLGEGADAPVERVRQTSDVMALRLLVDLYHAHDLRDDGGVGRHVVHGRWEREQVGQQGEYVVWGFPESSPFLVETLRGS